ncbi:MAG: hypothetical protein ACFFCF_07145 [Promethearchaeota archaeon]
MEASQVNMSNFQEAITSTQPSITQVTLDRFTQFANRFLGQ